MSLTVFMVMFMFMSLTVFKLMLMFMSLFMFMSCSSSTVVKMSAGQISVRLFVMCVSVRLSQYVTV